MAANTPTPEQLRREIEIERDQLAEAVDHLRDESSEATNVSAKLRAKLPALTAGALAAGFLAGRRMHPTLRLNARRSREGREKARFGRFSFVDRD